MEVDKIFFHLLDLTMLNSYINLPPWGSQNDHRKFHPLLAQKLLEMSTREPHPQPTSRGRPNPQMSQMM